MNKDKTKNNRILNTSKTNKIKNSSIHNNECSFKVPSSNETLHIHFQQNQTNNINAPPIFLNIKSYKEMPKIEENLKTNEDFFKKVSKNSNFSKGSLNSTNKRTLCESPNPKKNPISSNFKLFRNRNINSKCDVNSFDIPTDTNNTLSSLSNSNFLNYDLGVSNYSMDNTFSMELNGLKNKEKEEEEIIIDIKEYTYRDELKRRKNIKNKNKLNFENTEEYNINETKNLVNKSVYKIKNF